MRHTIWKKDDFFEIGGQRIDMDPAVVKFADKIPLTWQFDWTRDPSGQVTDIRFEDGEISGEVEFFNPAWTDEMMTELGCRLGGYYTGVDRNRNESQVLAAVLKGVSIITLDQTPGWPNRKA